MSLIWLSTYNHIGDELILTAVVRDFIRRYGERYSVGISSNHPSIWLNNPYIVRTELLHKSRTIFIRYAGDQHNASCGSCIDGFMLTLEQHLGIKIPVTEHKVDLYLSEAEQNSINPYGKYILLNAGFINKVPTKAYNHYQEVVDQCSDITFVQVGGRHDCHTPLHGNNVINLVGKTSVRELILLMYHAVGSLSPVSNEVHLASAWNKPSVVIAGGREPYALTGYANSSYLSSIGQYDCCTHQGCFKFTGCPYKKNGIYSKCMDEIEPEIVAKMIRKIW